MCNCGKRVVYEANYRYGIDPIENKEYIGNEAELLDGSTVKLIETIKDSNNTIVGYIALNDKKSKMRIFAKNVVRVYEK